MASQEYLYACYVNCNCNNCNLAAKPGFSNHQSGHALDLNTSAAGVLDLAQRSRGGVRFQAHGSERGLALGVVGRQPGRAMSAAGDAAIDGNSMSNEHDAGTSDANGASEREASAEPPMSAADDAGKRDDGLGGDHTVAQGAGFDAGDPSTEAPQARGQRCPVRRGGLLLSHRICSYEEPRSKCPAGTGHGLGCASFRSPLHVPQMPCNRQPQGRLTGAGCYPERP